MTEIPKDMNMRALRQRFDSSTRRFLRDQSGSITVLFAGGMIMMVGLAAIAVDLSYLFMLRGKLQSTADSVVLAAANQLPDVDKVQEVAFDYATKNMPTSNHGTVLVAADVQTGTWDFRARSFTPGGTAPNALRVITRRSGGNGNAAGLFFARALGFSDADVQTQAIGAQLAIGVPCLLSLDPSAVDAVKVNNGSVIVDGCALHVNSDDPGALDIALNGTLEAASICVRGGVDGNGTSTPGPQTGCGTIDDPLIDLMPPVYDDVCDYTNVKFTSGENELEPGVYCGGISLTGSASVSLDDGNYIIKGGSLKTAGTSASMIGEDVSFYFTDDAVLNLSGQGSVNLSAPTSGGDPLKGILFFGDRDADPDLKHSISGGANMVYDGTIYFPANEINFMGNGTGSSSAGYTAVIARLLKFGGNGSLTFKYPDGSGDVPLPDGLDDLTDGTQMALVN